MLRVKTPEYNTLLDELVNKSFKPNLNAFPKIELEKPDKKVFCSGRFKYFYTFSKGNIVDCYCNKLINYLYKRDYFNLIDEINYINNEMSNLSAYNKLVSDIRYVFNKFVVVRNFIRKVILKRRMDKCGESINTADLNLEDFNSDDECYNLYDIKNFTKYRLRNSEIINIMKFNLLYRDWETIAPKVPKNPYTNIELTLKNKIEMYQHILKVYSGKNKLLPIFLIYYKNSYFNIHKFTKKYRYLLYYYTFSNYLESLNDAEWEDEYDRLSYIPAISNFFCKKCIEAKLGVHKRLFFNRLLVINFLNTNYIYNYGKVENIYFNLMKQYDMLYHNHNHIKKPKIPNRLRKRGTPENRISNNLPSTNNRRNILNLNEHYEIATLNMELTDMIDEINNIVNYLNEDTN